MNNDVLFAVNCLIASGDSDTNGPISQLLFAKHSIYSPHLPPPRFANKITPFLQAEFIDSSPYCVLVRIKIPILPGGKKLVPGTNLIFKTAEGKEDALRVIQRDDLE